MPALPVGPQDLIPDIPFDRLFIEWPAQPGLIVNLWFGYGSGVKPSAANIATLTSITNPVDISDRAARLLGLATVQDVALLFSTSYVASSLITAGTPLNAVAAGSNVNGIRLHDAKVAGVQTTGLSEVTLLSKTTAPTTITDGDVIANADSMILLSTSFVSLGRILKPIRVASGKRLDFMVGTTDTIGLLKRLLYDLL
jgi:hypothetical protein